MIHDVTKFAGLALACLLGACSGDKGSSGSEQTPATSRGGSPPLTLPQAGMSSGGASAMVGGTGGLPPSPGPAEACQDLAGLGKCGATTVSADIRTVNILLVIDKSGSMTDQPSGFDVDKWSALKAALEQSLGKVAGDINFGLLLYPFSATQAIPLVCKSGCCEVPEGAAAVNVEVDAGGTSVPRILRALEQTEPGGGTPTAAALARANEYFTTGAGSALEGNSYVLLATDGGPNCNASNSCGAELCTPNLDNQCNSGNCCKSSGEYCLDDLEVTRQIEELKANGIPTFVVGIPGTEVYASYLDRFAQSGGVPNPAAPPEYYAVPADGGVQGLVDVFSGITSKLVRSCDILLTSDPPNLDEVNLAIDCEVVRPVSEDGSGWEIDSSKSPNSVVLKGEACERVQRDGARRVDVVYGCPTIR